MTISRNFDLGHAWRDADRKLGRDGGHNAVLAATLDDLNLRTLPWRAAQFSVHEPRRATSREEHREIAATILERDADGAREAMRRHIASSFFTLSEILGAPDR